MLSQYQAEFTTLALIHLMAMIIPGPDFAITLRQSIRFGRQIGIITACGIAVGLSVHVAYTLMGVGALLYRWPWLFNLLKLLGSAYILYLGWLFLTSHIASFQELSHLSVSKARPSWRQAFWRGFLTNVTNPKATLFFVAIFSAIVSVATPLLIKIAYGIWMCAINVLWFSLVSILLTQNRVRSAFIRLGHWFERAVGLLLIGFAIRLLWSAS